MGEGVALLVAVHDPQAGVVTQADCPPGPSAQAVWVTVETHELPGGVEMPVVKVGRPDSVVAGAIAVQDPQAGVATQADCPPGPGAQAVWVKVETQELPGGEEMPVLKVGRPVNVVAGTESPDPLVKSVNVVAGAG